MVNYLDHDDAAVVDVLECLVQGAAAGRQPPPPSHDRDQLMKLNENKQDLDVGL